MNQRKWTQLTVLSALLLGGQQADAQSSSSDVAAESRYGTATSYDRDQVAAERYSAPNDRSRRALPNVHPAVPRLTAYVNVRPQPREFMLNDLVEIIIAESFESEMDAEKSTEKTSDLSGGITQFPRITLADLLDLQLQQGTSGPALVELGFEREYEGEGEYERTESMTGRVRARIIDIKPNGMLVLEARRTIINDGEQSVLVATGNCMDTDITPEGTVRSNQLENLFIDKQHSGDLRESGEKGWLTKLFDAIFDF